ncbi:MAG: F0F1 ATP synthase subunit alpha, partial [Chloroflexi bacterium]|nr:F0F1 ATP synthase subunit alpha [Chloroflexota bacterium]
IIETQAGDISAYIPTNVSSITDGQIYLESDLFNAGIRPAVNVGLSVSRVGGSAQTRAMKRVAGRLRLDLAQYRELASFAQFGTADLDRATRAQLERGQRTVEVLKQLQYVPMPLEQEVMVLYAVVNGYLDDVAIPAAQRWEAEFHRFMGTAHPEIGKKIAETKDLDKETEEALKKAIVEFKQGFKA